jgi:hypothetical protein
VSASGMVAALGKWNRPIPLAWNHRTDAADIFGSIDPASVKEVSGEVVATGQVDLSSDVGREAWRSFKSRTIGFSFGYLILAATERKGGGRAITELDVFEITATPTPMNNETRVLGTKSVPELQAELQDVKGRLEKAEKSLADLMVSVESAQEPQARADDPLKQKARTLMMDVLGEGSKPPARVTQEQPPGPDIEPDELKRRSRDLIVQLLSE